MTHLRMCVVIASRATGRGGMETAISSVLRGLERQGHSTLIVLLEESEDSSWHRGLQSVAGSFPLATRALVKRMPEMIPWLRRVVGDFNPDVVLATEPRAIGLVRAAIPLGRPTVLSWLHNGVSLSNNRWLFTLCDGHLIVSRRMAVDLPGRARAFFVGNPCDCSVEQIPRPRVGARFVYVGRLSGEKRVDRILRAIARTPEAAQLQVFGDGPEKAALQSLARSLGIESRVNWCGWVLDPWKEMNTATALVLTSALEGLPLVLLEGAARGIPLIAMDCKYGPRDIVVQNENGWLLPQSDDGVELGGLLREIVCGSRPLPNPASVVRSAQPYSTDAVVRRIESAIRQTLETRRCGRRRDRTGVPDAGG